MEQKLMKYYIQYNSEDSVFYKDLLIWKKNQGGNRFLEDLDDQLLQLFKFPSRSALSRILD